MSPWIISDILSGAQKQKIIIYYYLLPHSLHSVHNIHPSAALPLSSSSGQIEQTEPSEGTQSCGK